MSGNKVFCPGSRKFGLGSKIFGPYCPRAVRLLTDLLQSALSTNFGKTVLMSFRFYSLYETLKKWQFRYIIRFYVRSFEDSLIEFRKQKKSWKKYKCSLKPNFKYSVNIEGIYRGDLGDLSQSLTYMLDLLWPKDITCCLHSYTNVFHYLLCPNFFQLT